MIRATIVRVPDEPAAEVSGDVIVACSIFAVVLMAVACGYILRRLSRIGFSSALRWRVEAQKLGTEPEYRQLAEYISRAEDRLGVVPDGNSTVIERATFIRDRVGNDDLFLILMRPAPPSVSRKTSARDARRLVDLRRLAYNDGATEHERAAARRAYERLLDKYSVAS